MKEIYKEPQITPRDYDQDLLEDVSEEEIISLWRSFKASGLSEDAAWNAVVTGIALDMAFSKSKWLRPVIH